MPNDQEAYDSWVRKQEAKGRPVNREGEVKIIANTANGPVDVTDILTAPITEGEIRPVKDDESYIEEYYGKNDV